MKRKLLNILGLSLIITTIGFIADGDPKEPQILVRFLEFFTMTGIVFLIVSAIYFTFTFAFRRIQKI